MKKNKETGLMAFMSRHMMSCDEAGFLVSRSCDSRLPFFRRVGLKFHLMTCALCRKYEKQLRQLKLIVDDYKESCECECHHHMDESSKKELNKKVCKELGIN